MKSILLSIAATVLITLQVFAAPGDTTVVRAHDDVDMTWYGRYKAWGVFPSVGVDYHRINLNYTIGCATGGCSDWDYTVTLFLLRPTGVLDSNVASIDTITTNPLVIDTTWNVFEVKDRYELARMITPYGGYMANGQAGYNNNWEHTLVYDLTDYQMLLKDSVEFEAFYSGWSSGFSSTLDFEMIEGTPARKVSKISKVWQSTGGAYTDPNNFNNNLFAQKYIQLDSGTVYSWLRITPSGHGFTNNQNCAEFCQRDYYVKVNSNTIATVNMWRDDCGLNPIYPQGGTWLYDRANWCPGGKAYWYDHNLTPHYNGSSFDLDFDIQNYAVTGATGTPPTYAIGNVLFEADQIAHTNDAELMEIIAPNNHEEFGRLNPLCGKATVRIRNKGENALTSCVIKYRINGGTWQTYNWSGNLAFYDEEVVEVPFTDLLAWQNLNGTNSFEARVEMPNNTPDEYALNDAKNSQFEVVEEFPRDIYLWIKTNLKGSDTWWTITRLDDNSIVSQGDNLSSNDFYYDTLSLAPGCYELLVGDRSKNGLSWWANNDGSGFIRLRGHSGTTFQKGYAADFGTERREYFVVKTGIGIEESSLSNLVFVYPNPSNGNFTIEADGTSVQDWTMVITSIDGKEVWAEKVEDEMYLRKTVSLNHLASGMYFLEVLSNNERTTRKVVID